MRSSFLLGVALIGAVSWYAWGDIPGYGGGFACTVASVTDGDTLRCRETERDGKPIRVRLSGISARERDGTCSPGHPCPAASAEAATAALERLALGERLICGQTGKTYGRRAAFCVVGHADLSCSMIAAGVAERWPRYDPGGRLADC